MTASGISKVGCPESTGSHQKRFWCAFLSLVMAYILPTLTYSTTSSFCETGRFSKSSEAPQQTELTLDCRYSGLGFAMLTLAGCKTVLEADFGCNGSWGLASPASSPFGARKMGLH